MRISDWSSDVCSSDLKEAKEIRIGILEAAWNERLNSLVSAFGGEDIDASLLCLLELGFQKADDPRFIGTLEQVERHLIHAGFLHRYAKPDHFEPPAVAFNVCTFWYIDALAATGRREDARGLFQTILPAPNSLNMNSVVL